MAGWTTTQWAIVILAALVGFFIGLMMCSGKKWKQRYRDEARLREEERKRHEEVERHYKHAEAERIAAKARDDRPPPKAR